jgi:hypothetical protein
MKKLQPYTNNNVIAMLYSTICCIISSSVVFTPIIEDEDVSIIPQYS